jgi:hypothetical protein
MLVIGPLFQIATFLVQFLALRFPTFALSFALGRIGMVFQVSYKELQAKISILTPSRMPLRMASLRLFNMTLNIKWVATYGTLVLQHATSIQTDVGVGTLAAPLSATYYFAQSTFVLVASLSYLAFTSHLEYGHSCRSS